MEPLSLLGGTSADGALRASRDRAPFTVSASGELVVTFTGNGAGVRLTATTGSTPDLDTGQAKPLSLAQQQALEQLIHRAFEALRVDLSLLLEAGPRGTN